jgi:hypothetical protein
MALIKANQILRNFWTFRIDGVQMSVYRNAASECYSNEGLLGRPNVDIWADSGHSRGRPRMPAARPTFGQRAGFSPMPQVGDSEPIFPFQMRLKAASRQFTIERVSSLNAPKIASQHPAARTVLVAKF